MDDLSTLNPTLHSSPLLEEFALGPQTMSITLQKQYQPHNMRCRASKSVRSTSTGLIRVLYILGRRSSSMDNLSQLFDTLVYNVPWVLIYIYPKEESRKGRKVGCTSIVGSAETRAQLWPLLIELGNPNIGTHILLCVPRTACVAQPLLLGVGLGDAAFVLASDPTTCGDSWCTDPR